MGKYDTHGGRFAPQGYTKVNEGGSHEGNPNGGVQMGVDSQGVPNMLEEGEPVYKDFVYSDRIRVDRRLCRKFNIPEKYAGKLYSDAADSLISEAEERPLDNVSRNGLDAMLGRLADMQEEQKARSRERKLGGTTNELSDDELAALGQALLQEDVQDGSTEDATAADIIGQDAAQYNGTAAQEAAMQDAAASEVDDQGVQYDGQQMTYGEGGPKKGGKTSPGYRKEKRKEYRQAEKLAQDVLAKIESDMRAEYGLRDFESFAKDDSGNMVYGDDGKPVILRGEQGLAPEDWKFAAALAGGRGLGNTAMRAAAGRAADTAGRVLGLTGLSDDATKAANGELTAGDIPDVALDAMLAAPAFRGAATYGKAAGDATNLGIRAGARNAKDLSRLGRARRYIMDPTYSGRFHNGDWGKLRKGVQKGVASAVDLSATGAAVDKGIGIGKKIGEARTGAGYYSSQSGDDDFYGVDGYGAESDFSLGGKLKDGRANMFGDGSPAETHQVSPSGGIATPEYLKAQLEIQDSIDYANDEADGSSQGGGDGMSYPVWPRYAGAALAGIEGLYNALQSPDRYKIPHYRPVLPAGSLHLENPEYSPVGTAQALAQLSASTAAGLRAARNSGMGPSLGTTLAALDSSYGKNAGSLVSQIQEINNQRRNNAIAQRNASAAQEAQFDYNINAARAQALNNARLQNIQNDLMRQRLNNAAEAEKYAALRSSLDALSQALAGIGTENFYRNQLNGDSSYDYITGPDGRTYYAPKENTGGK